MDKIADPEKTWFVSEMTGRSLTEIVHARNAAVHNLRDRESLSRTLAIRDKELERLRLELRDIRDRITRLLR